MSRRKNENRKGDTVFEDSSSAYTLIAPWAAFDLQDSYHEQFRKQSIAPCLHFPSSVESFHASV